GCRYWQKVLASISSGGSSGRRNADELGSGIGSSVLLRGAVFGVFVGQPPRAAADPPKTIPNQPRPCRGRPGLSSRRLLAHPAVSQDCCFQLAGRCLQLPPPRPASTLARRPDRRPSPDSPPLPEASERILSLRPGLGVPRLRLHRSYLLQV